MCIAALQNTDTIISDKILEKMYSHNRDGCGLLYINKDSESKIDTKLMCYKTMDFQLFKETYHKEVAIYGKYSPFVLHFRTGTRGIRDLTNCHPFFVNDRIAFVHNGIIPISGDTNKSDTSLFNETVLQPMCNTNINMAEIFENKVLLNMISDVCGHSKFIFLSDDGRHLIINENAGEWIDGCWYSAPYIVKEYTHNNVNNNFARNDYHSNTQRITHGYQNTYGTHNKTICDICNNNELVTVYEKNMRMCTSCCAERKVKVSVDIQPLCCQCKKVILPGNVIRVKGISTHTSMYFCEECIELVSIKEMLDLLMPENTVLTIKRGV